MTRRTTLAIVRFLRLRLDEQEARLRDMDKSPAVPRTLLVNRTLRVALGQVAAQRKILDEVEGGHFDSDYDSAVEHMAAVYADHPDYDAAWSGEHVV